MTKLKNNRQANIWLTASTILTAVLILFACVLNNLISDTSVDRNTYSSVAGSMCVYAVAVFIICLITIFKVKALKKLVPVFSILLVSIIFAWLFFVSSFTSGGFTF